MDTKATIYTTKNLILFHAIDCHLVNSTEEKKLEKK